MSYTDTQIWALIAGLAVGTFLIRFSFLGLIGNRALPAWVLRLLRYTPVAVLPGIVAPLVLWPPATDGSFDPARGLAALATLVVGYATRSVIWGALAGAGTLYLALYLLS